MIVLNSIDQLQIDEPIAIAIGFFDGLHLGHKMIVSQMIRDSQNDFENEKSFKNRKIKLSNQRRLSAVLTFKTHPSKIANPECPVKVIFPNNYKIDLIKQAGVDVIINQEFDSNFANQTPLDFVKSLKKNFPKLSSIYIGNDFHFGKNRSGNFKIMREICASFDIKVVSFEKRFFGAQEISSSLVRNKIANGKIEEANAILGHSYFITTNFSDENVHCSENFPDVNVHCFTNFMSENFFAKRFLAKNCNQREVFSFIDIPWNPELKPPFGTYLVKVNVCSKTHFKTEDLNFVSVKKSHSFCEKGNLSFFCLANYLKKEELLNIQDKNRIFTNKSDEMLLRIKICESDLQKIKIENKLKIEWLKFLKSSNICSLENIVSQFDKI